MLVKSTFTSVSEQIPWPLYLKKKKKKTCGRLSHLATNHKSDKTKEEAEKLQGMAGWEQSRKERQAWTGPEGDLWPSQLRLGGSMQKKWEENWTLQIKSANHLPEVKAQNIKGDTNVTIIFTYKTLCLSFHATKHVKWVNFVVLLFF